MPTRISTTSMSRYRLNRAPSCCVGLCTAIGICKTRFASPARPPVTDVWSTICQSKGAGVDRRRTDREVLTQAPGTVAKRTVPSMLDFLRLVGACSASDRASLLYLAHAVQRRLAEDSK